MRWIYPVQRCLAFAFPLAFLLFFAVIANAVLFNDGAIHTIDAANSFPLDGLSIQDGPDNATTTVNIVPGGRVGSASIPGDVQAVDHSLLNISGGIVQGGSLTFTEYAVLNMTGGTLTGSLFFLGDAVSFVSGGDFLWPAYVESGTQLNVAGGVFHSDLQVQNFAQLFISGGSLNGVIRALDFSATTIVGSGFNFPLGDLSAASGVLTGTLADGTPLDVNFSRASRARITLTLIPEPSTALLLAGGLFALALSPSRKSRAVRTSHARLLR